MSSGRAPHRVALVITDGLPIFEVSVPCEVFGISRPDLADPWYELTLVAGEPGELHTACDFLARPRAGLEFLREADTVIVPASERTMQLRPPEPLLAALQAAAERGARIASLCTGAYLLAYAGLLRGRRATTHWMNLDDFSARFPDVDVQPNVLYTEDDGILTSAGTAATIDLCLHLVRQDLGADVANSVAKRMVVTPHREGGQAQFVEPMAARIPADPMGYVIQWALAHLGGDLSVEALAHRARMSRRTFHRRFHQATGATPAQWVVARRVDYCRRLLETTDLSVEQIAARSGMGSPASLRAHFTAVTTVSPSSYRRLFRQAG